MASGGSTASSPQSGARGAIAERDASRARSAASRESTVSFPNDDGPRSTEASGTKRRDSKTVLSVRGAMLQRMESFGLASTPVTAIRKGLKEKDEIGAGAIGV